MSIFNIIKESISFEYVCSDYNLEFRNGKTHCPFHDEKTPSFHNFVTHAYCFGCGKIADAVDLEACYTGLSLFHAALSLAKRYGILLPEFSKKDKEKFDRQLEAYKLLEKLASYANKKIKQHPQMMQFLKNKGLDDKDIDQYLIGYIADEDPVTNKLTDENEIELAIEIGLIKKSSNGGHYDHFKNRIIIPIWSYGKIVFLTGRAFPESEPRYLHLKNSELVHKVAAFSENLQKSSCIVTEGITDSIAYLKAGYPACALLGTNPGELIRKELGRAKAKLNFAMDPDSVGQEAAYKLAKECKGHIINLEQSRDPDEIIAEVGVEDFKIIVDRAVASAKMVSNESAEKSDLIDVNGDGRGAGSQAERLVALIEGEDLTLFYDQLGEPFAKFKVQDHYETYKVRSKHFKRWISKLYWDSKGKIPNSESLNSALNIIEAKACFEGVEYTLHNRVAWHDNSIWYDLGNWHAVKINEDGWSIVNEPPILFRRFSHQKQQATPEEADCKKLWKELFNFVNISNENDKLLYSVSLVCGVIPDIPHPIDVSHGDQGTAKTSSSKVKKELLDPSELKTQTFHNTKSEFVQLAYHHWYLFLDNLSGLPGWLSDSLCRIVTGEGFSKRELYTDDDDIIYSFKRCIGLNGINLVPTKPDLLDRSLIFEFDPIPQNKRKEENDFWKVFNETKPRLLGAIFSTLSKAMKEYPKIILNSKPRMADFARWGCAIAKVLGKKEKDFIDAYFDNIRTQNKEALDASPIAGAIITFMSNGDDWDGTASELLEELNKIAEKQKIDVKDKRYPKDSRWLWRRIKEVRTNLMAVGIIATKDDSKRDSEGRKILIENKPLGIDDDNAQKGTKNDVSDVMTSESQQEQVLTPDTKADNNKNDGENIVRRNSLESLDSDNTDNTDNTFAYFKGKIEKLRHTGDGPQFKIQIPDENGKPTIQIITSESDNFEEIRKLYEQQNRS